MIVTPLEALWAATTEEKADQARTLAWSSLQFPITVGNITITDCTISLPVVEFHGSGGTLSWPLRLIGAPIGIPDAAGREIDPDGVAWRTDPHAVLRDVLEQYR